MAFLRPDPQIGLVNAPSPCMPTLKRFLQHGQPRGIPSAEKRAGVLERSLNVVTKL